MRKIDKTGQIHGRLTVLKEIGSKFSGGKNRIFWLCLCTCGNKVEIVSDGIGKTLSCGCLNKEMIGALNFKHGEANKTKENKTWQHIQSRCYCQTDKKYPLYGGRGIVVCDRWLNSYEDFLFDMGRAPKGNYSIERIDVNGNYEPRNCKWADNKEQSNNRRTNVVITHNGVTLNIKQWAERLGVNYKTLHARLRYKRKNLTDIING